MINSTMEKPLQSNGTGYSLTRDVYRYGAEVNSHDLVKVLAISTMVIDHIGRFFLDNNVWFRVVGRMAAPLFFFLVGYSGSYRFKSHILLYGFALSMINYLTTPSFTIYQHIQGIVPLNILVSFTLIKALLSKFTPAKLPTEFLIVLLSILMFFSLPTYFLIEYGTLGLCYAIGARLLNQGHRFRYVWICVTVGVHFCYEAVMLLVLNAGVSTRLIPLAAGLLAVVFLANLVIFLNYNLRIFKINQRYLRTLALYVSRYSLEVYFFHLSAFMIISYI